MIYPEDVTEDVQAAIVVSAARRTPDDSTVERVLCEDIVRLRAALKNALFALQSSIMLQGNHAFVPYANTIESVLDATSFDAKG